MKIINDFQYRNQRWRTKLISPNVPSMKVALQTFALHYLFFSMYKLTTLPIIDKQDRFRLSLIWSILVLDAGWGLTSILSFTEKKTCNCIVGLGERSKVYSYSNSLTGPLVPKKNHTKNHTTLPYHCYKTKTKKVHLLGLRRTKPNIFSLSKSTKQ